jgi:hypothetical protein
MRDMSLDLGEQSEQQTGCECTRSFSDGLGHGFIFLKVDEAHSQLWIQLVSSHCILTIERRMHLFFSSD